MDTPEHISSPSLALRRSPEDAPLFPRTDAVSDARAHLQDEEEAARREAGPPVRRIYVCGILLLFGGVLFFVILPYYRVYLPPIVPIAAFATILFGAIASGRAERDIFVDPEDDERLTQQPEDDGRPVMCCPGPRPLRMFRESPRREPDRLSAPPRSLPFAPDR